MVGGGSWWQLVVDSKALAALILRVALAVFKASLSCLVLALAMLVFKIRNITDCLNAPPLTKSFGVLPQTELSL